jgi:hypothetical protein
VAIASAAEPGEAGRHHRAVAIARAAEPGEAGRHHRAVAIARAAEPGEAGRHHRARWLAAREQEIRTAFADHDRGRVGVGAGNLG